MQKRPVDIVIISDIHLGTYGCHAKELLKYLKSIQPKKVILNGDIIDIWQFRKRYWPKDHMKVIKHIMNWITKDIPVHYITGNHDEMLRKFVKFEIGSFSIDNKLNFEIDSKMAWVFHGDVFDVTMQHSKWLAQLGAIGYDSLILINKVVNFISQKVGGEPISMSKKIKNSVKSAVKFINNFEQIAADIAIENGYDFVICGHIHQPIIKKIATTKGSTTYLNSGDWIENLTSLEFYDNQWKLYHFHEDTFLKKKVQTSEYDNDEILKNEELFEKMLLDFQTKTNLLQ